MFASQLIKFEIDDSGSSNYTINLQGCWQDLTEKEKRLLVEQLLGRIMVGRAEIKIEFAYSPNSFKTPDLWQQNNQGNEISKSQSSNQTETALNEPLMNEAEAAKFLGISKMTLLRRRNAGEIGFFRVGFRFLYSKEKHLLPFLQLCEK